MSGPHAHPDVWLLIAAIGGGYAWALRRLGRSLVDPIERVASRRQVLFFAAGLVTLWAAADWPIHDLAEGYLYSVHMVQHLLISLVAAPLFILGTPDRLVRRMTGPRAVLAAVRVLGRPFVALVVFNTVIAVMHVPAVVDLTAHHHGLHFFAHAVLFFSALFMWLPVLNRSIELRTLSYPGRMMYLFLMSLVPTVPASFLTFGNTVLYRYYATVPRLWGISALTDQKIAGLLMKLGGGAILWAVIGWYFFKWAKVEEKEGIDVLEWGKVDRGVDEAELVRT